MIVDLNVAEIQESKQEGSGVGETREEYIERITEEGRFVWLPEKNELFIDIDNEKQFEIFMRSWSILEREHPNADYEVWNSKHGYPRQHILVTLPFKLNSITRIAYQAAMGSDPVRELLSIFRVENGETDPTLFAEDTERYS